MTTRTRTSPEPLWQQWLERLIPVQTLTDALALAHRFRELEGLQIHVQERLRLVIPATIVVVFVALACAIGVVVFLADFHPLLTLVGILLLPVVLIGSLFVLAYVFFSWVEGRALVRELGNRHRPASGAAARWLTEKFGVDIGPAPPLPWFLATLFLLAPLALLAASSPGLALAVILLGIAMPLVYAKLDA